MSTNINKPVAPSVRKSVQAGEMVLRILELQHAVLLHLENEHPSMGLEELNNGVRSLLDQAWKQSSFSLRVTTDGS